MYTDSARSKQEIPATVKEEVDRLVALAGNATEAFTAALFVFDEKKRDTLTLYACHSLSTSLNHDTTIPVGHGLIGWVAKNDKATHAQNFDRDATAALKFYTEDEDIKSFMASPVRDGDRVIGVLAIDSKKERVFTDRALKLLGQFAVAIGGALVRSRKMIRLEQEAMALGSLSRLVDRVTACQSVGALARELRLLVREIIPHDFLVLAVRSFESDQFHLVQNRSGASPKGKKVALSLASYRLGMVIQGGTPIFVPEIGAAAIFPGCDESFRSFLGVPMIANNEAVGAIGLLSRKPKVFTKSDERILSVLMAACASAFASLRAHNLKRLSDITDPITGLYNHRYLLGQDMALEGEGAVGVVNLIGFTRINAEIGMAGGDSVLIETANRLKQVVKETGSICRYYGDRFIIHLENRDETESIVLFDTISDAIESKPYYYEGVEIHIKPAIGVALYPADGESAEELVANAFTASSRATITPGLRVSRYGATGSPASLRSIK